MNMKFISFTLLITALLACSNKTTETQTQVKPQQETTEVATPPAQPEVATDTLNAVNSGAPEYMNLQLQGYGVDNINLSSLHGEVIFLNHWGSWCGPCRMEMPSIQELYNNYGDKVKFVMVASEKRPGAHIPYIEKEGFTFPVYSMLSPASTEIKPKAFPATIIIDKTGKIRTNDVGAANWNSPNVHEFLDKLLAE